MADFPDIGSNNSNHRILKYASTDYSQIENYYNQDVIEPRTEKTITYGTGDSILFKTKINENVSYGDGSYNRSCIIL